VSTLPSIKQLSTAQFFFRADANIQIGSGHIVRCRILARELKKMNRKSAFIIKSSDKKFENELQQEGFEVYRIYQKDDETIQILNLVNSSGEEKKMLVIDSDETLLHEENFQLRCINNAVLLMHIIFLNEHKYRSHIVHNQNPIALENRLETESYTRKLLGLKYVILDRSFEGENIRSEAKDAIFISFGGSDKPNRTLFLLKALNGLNIDIDKVIIVIGLMYPFKNELECFLKTEFRYGFEVYQNTSEMSKLMAKSMFGFTSGGFATWELGVFKAKSSIISYTEREEISAEFLHKKKLGYHIGNIKNLSLEQLQKQLVFLMKDEILPQNAERLYQQLDVNGRIKVVNEMIKVVDSF
jgi:UDP-2,4-diacetamido-2,4,6-trideoxy-beta-L-altropyranose hydrolase